MQEISCPRLVRFRLQRHEMRLCLTVVALILMEAKGGSWFCTASPLVSSFFCAQEILAVLDAVFVVVKSPLDQVSRFARPAPFVSPVGSRCCE